MSQGGRCVVRTVVGEGFLKAPVPRRRRDWVGSAPFCPPPGALLPFSQIGGVCLSSPLVPSPGVQAALHGTHVLSVLPGPGAWPALSREPGSAAVRPVCSSGGLERARWPASECAVLPALQTETWRRGEGPDCQEAGAGAGRLRALLSPLEACSFTWEAAPTGARRVSRPGTVDIVEQSVLLWCLP